MPVGDTTLIDIRAFLAIQRQERYQAFVLHAPPNKDIERRKVARKLAALEGGSYLDVLSHVAAAPELSDAVDLIDAAHLRQFAMNAAEQSRVLVVVDEFDFLIPVWGDDLSAFQQTISTLSRTDAPCVIVFSMQTRSALEKWDLTNTHRHSRIHSLDIIQKLS